MLDVSGEAVDVPRPLLDIISRPPHRWSVVPRPKNPARFPGVTEYGVCPNCRERVPLTARLAALRCRHCNEVFDVAWEKQNFQGVWPNPNRPCSCACSGGVKHTPMPAS